MLSEYPKVTTCHHCTIILMRGNKVGQKRVSSRKRPNSLTCEVKETKRRKYVCCHTSFTLTALISHRSLPSMPGVGRGSGLLSRQLRRIFSRCLPRHSWTYSREQLMALCSPYYAPVDDSDMLACLSISADTAFCSPTTASIQYDSKVVFQVKWCPFSVPLPSSASSRSRALL
jgi:hypothetical protein